MSIIGFNFTKMSAEKMEATKAKISIKNSINITKVEDTSISLGDKGQKGMKITFSYILDYQPNFGKIELGCNFIMMEEAQVVDKAIEAWMNKKPLTKEIMEKLTNYAMSKCAIQSLILAKEVNLPSAIKLPKYSLN